MVCLLLDQMYHTVQMCRIVFQTVRMWEVCAAVLLASLEEEGVVEHSHQRNKYQTFCKLDKRGREICELKKRGREICKETIKNSHMITTITVTITCKINSKIDNEDCYNNTGKNI